MSVGLYFSKVDIEKSKEIKVDMNELKLINTQTVQIIKPENNLFTLFPITFSDGYYSTAHFAIYTSVMDYNYRPTTLELSTKEDIVKIIINKSEMKNVEKGLRKNVAMGDSFETVLFPAENAVEELDTEHLKSLYNTFIKSLINATDELKSRILVLRKKFSWETKELSKTHSGAILKVEEKILNPKMLESESTMADEELKESPENIEMKKWIAEAQCSSNPKMLIDYLRKTISEYKSLIIQLWNQLLDVLILVPHQTATMLLENFSRERIACFEQFTKSSVTKVIEFPYLIEKDIITEHQNAVKSIRSTILSKSIGNFAIKDKLFDNLDEIPIIFEDIYIKEELPSSSLNPMKSTGEDCLLVLVHGFEGSSCDVKLMRNVILFRFPKLQTLCSKNNEDKTDGSIQEMGNRLAKEVCKYISDCLSNNPPRISFIGHSLGGIIIRTALPNLEKYKNRMQAFITLSTPHLGCIHQSSKLIGVGMWIFKKWKSSISLDELAMSDHKDLKETFMYKLSKTKGLEWFKHVVLVSSYLDHYSPYESSRIEISKNHADDLVYKEMAHNILSRIKSNKLYRVDVVFNIKKTSINSLIGREAHLQFLENKTLLKMLTYRYSNLFID